MKSPLFTFHFSLFTFFLIVSCSSPKVPETFAESDKTPVVYPDVVDVTVPVNIAPLTFEWDDSIQPLDMVTRMTIGANASERLDSSIGANASERLDSDGELILHGLKVQPSPSDWRDLATKAQGKAINVEVFTQGSDERWTRHRPFSIYVSPDSIDPWLSYRLISPSYVAYEELTLNQRCLETYDESVMVDNMLCGLEKTGQCVNCHNYQQYNPGRMQFHARQFHGGTVIVYDGKMKKVNMRNDSIISAGVYPAWHPWLPVIVYSTNHTGQSFHTRNLNKIEVFDSASDLIVYDVESDEVSNIENRTDEFEVFPAWVPDGKTLYYCSAHFEFLDTVSPDVEVIRRAKEIKYNIYKKSFDPETRKFGPRELVYQADSIGANLGANASERLDSSIGANASERLDSVVATVGAVASFGRSATLPRVSPDGRFLLFTEGNYGVFHIWHREADLYLMDLQTGTVRPFTELNSPDTESYHSWSSNGRWVVFSSRRDDGGYTRPFIAHVDADGHGSKPFELPQRDPDYHRQFLKSYNIPELMRGPVDITPQEFADLLKKDDGVPVSYKQINR